MDLTLDLQQIIGRPESSTLEYKAVLPPSKNIAQLICSFANTDGGYIVLGVTEGGAGGIEINGLSEEFHANSITHKAIDLLTPQPQIFYQYVVYKGKKLYVIKVDKSPTIISLDGKVYKRVGDIDKLSNPIEMQFRTNGYARIKTLNTFLETSKRNSTNSKVRILEHYQSILKIIDDLGAILYPEGVDTPTNNQEGKVLSRILFSSFVDNFETYLSELLYEIFLATPSTLKSNQQVSIEEVLNCSDLQEFVKYWAKQKIGKLQKGSVKGFIKDNKQISELGVFDESKQNDIEKILQIRHLYSHRNGIVDEKFLQYFAGQFTINSIHEISISDFCNTLNFLTETSSQIDTAAIAKFKLACIN